VLFYPTFPFTTVLRLGNYWTDIDNTTILGCAPFAILGHPHQLHKLGVRGVVNMCYEYPGPKDAYANIGIKQMHIPVVDHEEPSLDQMNEAIEFIKSFREKNHKVYIHCKAGHGRGAAIALCWLMNQNPNAKPKVISKSFKL
jgi:atypical dual specificity phosphatase